ncbi:MAG: GNAT family N-acetyltransferase [Bacteroidetes bacterium]|nr:GNAT family N-acetyltransferase [Bacteroidota bacterium]
MTDARYRSALLGSHHNRATFSSGDEALDRYFHLQAGQDQRRSVALPYVLVDTTTGDVAGYYTLSTSSIVPTNLPEALIRKLPRYQALPTLLLGRLAVDQHYRGQGVGRLLLLDALARCLDVSRQVGLIGIVVDAKGDVARSFYEHFGFIRFVSQEYRLFLPMPTIAHLDL